MEKQYKEYSYFDEDPKKGIGFILALVALLLFTMMGVGLDFDEYLQHESLNIPLGYFYSYFFNRYINDCRNCTHLFLQKNRHQFFSL